jgi:hypothetical protein
MTIYDKLSMVLVEISRFGRHMEQCFSQLTKVSATDDSGTLLRLPFHYRCHIAEKDLSKAGELVVSDILHFTKRSA